LFIVFEEFGESAVEIRLYNLTALVRGRIKQPDSRRGCWVNILE